MGSLMAAHSRMDEIFRPLTILALALALALGVAVAAT
jgi:hypothetical protein